MLFIHIGLTGPGQTEHETTLSPTPTTATPVSPVSTQATKATAAESKMSAKSKASTTPTKKPQSKKQKLSPAVQKFLQNRKQAQNKVKVKAEGPSKLLFGKYLVMWETHSGEIFLAMSEYDRPLQDTILKHQPWQPESDQWLCSIRNTKKDQYGPPREILVFDDLSTDRIKVYSYWLYNGKKSYEELLSTLDANNFIKGRGFRVKGVGIQPLDAHLIDEEIADLLIAQQHQHKPEEQDGWYFGNRYPGLTQEDFWGRPGMAERLEASEASSQEVQNLA